MPTSGTRTDGNTTWTDALIVSQPVSDGFSFAPPSEFTTVPVANITYSQDQFAGPSSTKISAAKAVNATGNATALYHLDLTDLLCRVAAGKGVTITEIDVVFTLTTQPLTGNPTCTVLSQTFAAAGAAAAAPTTSATAGGSITATNPAALTAPTAGNTYTAGFVLGTPAALNNPLQRVYAELAFPMTVGGSLYLVGAVVKYQDARY